MKRTIERQVIPIVLGFVPVIQMLLTWAPDGHMSPAIHSLRWTYFPVIMAELFVILVALREKMLPALRHLAVPRPLLVVALGLLAIAVLTSALAAPSSLAACLQTTYWIVHVLFGLSILHLCGRAFAGESLTTALMAGFCLFTILFVVFVIQVPDPASFNWVNGLPGMTHVRHFGFYAAAVFGLCIGRFAVAGSRTHWVATLAVAGLAVMLALWTGTRGALAAGGVGFVAGLALFPALRRWRVGLGVIGSGVMGFTLTAWLPAVPHHDWGLWRTVAATFPPSGNFTSGRTHLWLRTLEAVSERPWFGYGDGQLLHVVPLARTLGVVQPHNVGLQVLLAWGVVGTLCVLVLAIAFAVRATRRVRFLGGEWLPPFLGMIVLVAYSGSDGTLYYPLTLAIFAACAGHVAVSCGYPNEGVR